MNDAMRIASLFSVQGKVALVTGANRGIGLMIARAFVANGVRTYIVGRDRAVCADTGRVLGEVGSCTAIVADLTDDRERQRIAGIVADREGRLDILINNAGIASVSPLGSVSEESWDSILDVNLKAPFMLIQALLPLLKAAASPDCPARIVNIGSISGTEADAQDGYSYCASKAALAQLTRNLARVLARDGITVNLIAPGSTRTENFDRHLSAEAVLPKIPLNRLGGPADMAGAALYFSSPAAAWVTGTTLTVDGGQLLK